MSAAIKTVMVFGSFDVIHPGHLYFFRKARSFGNRLIVVVGRDETVEKIKGKKPLNDEKTRLKNLSSVPTVNEAILGSLRDPYAVIEKIKPDVICLGYDQKAFADKLEEELKKRGLSVKITRIPAYRPNLYKTSKLLKNKARGINRKL